MFLNFAIALLIKTDFSVLKPDLGQIFWSIIFFVLFWILIGRFAFKPIAEALKKRQDDIQSSLDEAKTARAEIANLKSENEALLAQAKEDPNTISSNVSAVVNYGVDHPYGEIVTEESVAKVTVDRAKAYYDVFFKPNISSMVGQLYKTQGKEKDAGYTIKGERS